MKFKDLSCLYVSSSIEKIFGFTQSEFVNGDQFFNLGNNPVYASVYMKIAKYVADFHTSDNDKTKYGVKYISGGVPFKHKDGSTRTSLTKYHVNVIEKGVMPTVDICISYDVSELMKKDEFWVYQEKMVDNKHICRFYCDEKAENHLISPREKEVLALIAEGKSSKEVAQELNISVATVSQHRKNMLRRTRAKDSSALIQLCKICEVL